MLLPIRVDEFLDSLLSGWVSVLYGADIQFAQHGEVDAMLNLGTERMSRAFGNILKNAIDAVETSGVKQIDLFISDEGDSVNFLFKDSGVGIPPEIMSEIFCLSRLVMI